MENSITSGSRDPISASQDVSWSHTTHLLPRQSSIDRLSSAWCISTTPESGEAGAEIGPEAAIGIYPKIFAPAFYSCFSVEWEKDVLSSEESRLNFLAVKSTGFFLKKQHQKTRTKQGHANANVEIFFFAIQPNK